MTEVELLLIAILDELQEQTDLLEEVLAALSKPVAKSATLTLVAGK